MYEIEDNIPLPKNRAGALAKYPWKKLKVGQSFAVTLGEMSRASIASQTSAAAKKLGIKLTGRHDKETGIVRIWRVK